MVAVGNNPAKRYLFDLEQRMALVDEVCAGIHNVEISAFEGLLVDKAHEVKAQVILRGLRALSDFDMVRYSLANRDLADIETLFLLSSPDNIYVSSLVKEIIFNGGDGSRYVPAVVLAALKSKFSA